LEALTVEAGEAVTVRAAGRDTLLPPGRHTLTLHDARPARMRYHVFPRTFAMDERAEAQAWMAEWAARGHEPEPVAMGADYRSVEGRRIRNRRLWMSLARFDTQAEAEAFADELEADGAFGWVRAERVEEGGGLLRTDAAPPLALPVRLEAAGGIVVARDGQRHGGALVLETAADGLLTVTEALPVEDYLARVLPAEMPAEWPRAALEAQAVAARSEVLASMYSKRVLEGYHFVAGQVDRMFRGEAHRHPRTDAAVAATAGRILVRDGHIAPAVFSSNCGGWTAANETVWSAPPNPALRPVADLVDAAGAPSPVERGLADWVAQRPAAWCAADERFFRWERRLTEEALTAAVNERHPVGRVLAIEAGPRGEGGRLTRVTVVGDAGRATIGKESAIRFAFGGLPSAVFTVDRVAATGAPVFVFRGAGRGHGVGMCQWGARGMAGAGHTSREILRHYFSDVAITRVR
jgi:SpoIID/LytB domain protein